MRNSERTAALRIDPLLESPQLRDKLGICQWFHYNDYDAVRRAVMLLRKLNVRHLRTGISWADYHRKQGRDWYDWMLDALKDFDVLLSIWHTPPSISEGNSCASPPRRLQDFADFIDLVISRYRKSFCGLELWNEPNNRLKWDFQRFDPDWRKFAEMIAMAAHWAHSQGVRTVLGGMIPVDPHWLKLMKQHGALQHVHTIAIHAFPGMWWANAPNWEWYRDWKGWSHKVNCLCPHSEGRPIWVTETGLATWDLSGGYESRFDLQVESLLHAAAAPVERIYWYSLMDLDPQLSAIEGYHVDENEYHLGLTSFQGIPKPAFHRMKELLRFGVQ